MVQVLFAVIMALSHLLTTAYMKPYAKQYANTMAISCSLMLVFIFLSCIPLKLQMVLNSGVLIPPQLMPFVDVPEDYVVNFLLLSTFGAMGTAAALAVVIIRSQRTLTVVRNNKGDIVQMPFLEHKERWHFFLSHQWTFAQDSCRVIKSRLLELVPGVRIFLDVDDLVDLNNLEAEIEATQVVIFFLSKGYFQSRNVRVV